MYKGIIYKATNKTNGMVYVGQTTKSLEERIKGHLAKAKGYGTIFSVAIKTLGADAFDWEIIETIEAETPEMLRSFLFVAENYHIMKNMSFLPERGYNTIGVKTGRRMRIRDVASDPINTPKAEKVRSPQARPVALYDLSGEMVKYFATAVLARNYTNKDYFLHTTDTSIYIPNAEMYRGVLLHLRSRQNPPKKICIITPNKGVAV